MKKAITGNVSIDIDAPKSKVWDALTNPEQIKKYLFGTQTSSDWKVGSTITFRGEWEGKAYEDKGTILQIEPEKILKYSYWSSMSNTKDEPDNYQIMTYVLESAGVKTRLSILQESCPSEEAREHSENNWKYVLETMKAMLEK